MGDTVHSTTTDRPVSLEMSAKKKVGGRKRPNLRYTKNIQIYFNSLTSNLDSEKEI